jgi:hypothetical protein
MRGQQHTLRREAETLRKIRREQTVKRKKGNKTTRNVVTALARGRFESKAKQQQHKKHAVVKYHSWEALTHNLMGEGRRYQPTSKHTHTKQKD